MRQVFFQRRSFSANGAERSSTAGTGDHSQAGAIGIDSELADLRLRRGQGRQAAGPVLAVHIWASLFVFYGVAQGPWDLTENLTRLAMVRIVIGAIVNILLNLWLVLAYGALGAAVATVVSQALAAVILNILHEKTRPIFYCQLKSLLFVRYLRGL